MSLRPFLLSFHPLCLLRAALNANSSFCTLCMSLLDIPPKLIVPRYEFTPKNPFDLVSLSA